MRSPWEQILSAFLASLLLEAWGYPASQLSLAMAQGHSLKIAVESSFQGLSPGHISHRLQAEETAEVPICSLDLSQAKDPVNWPKGGNDRCRDILGP